LLPSYPSFLFEGMRLAHALPTFRVWVFFFFCPDPSDNFFSLFTLLD